MKHQINGELVVLARELRRLTQKDLSEKSGIGQGTVAKVEGGTSKAVSEKILNSIASALSFPVSFFQLSADNLSFGSSNYFYRKKAKISVAERKYINSVVNITRINIDKMLSHVDFSHSIQLPTIDIDEYGSAADIANVVRAKWKIPDGPIRNLTHLVEKAGILIVPCDFKCEYMDATSLNLNNSMPMVFINKNMPGDRWRHTLAHELGHLIMHDSHTETMENEADLFASELLAPVDDIAAQLRPVGKIQLNDLVKLKPFWKVSIASLIMRAEHAGLLTPNQKKYLWVMRSKHGWNKKEPEEIALESPRGHKSLIGNYFDNLGYTLDDLAKTLSVPADVLVELHGGSIDLPEPPREVKLRVVG